tara:strand:- start:3548 stop:3742 length:195 start_codon:yes stop_codon:yes gene_type:complete
LKRDQLWGVVVVVVVIVVVGIGVIALLKSEKIPQKNERKNHVSNLVFALSHPPAGLKRSSSLPR